MHVRLAHPGDEPVLRRLRLDAMTGAPAAYGSTYEHEAARTPEDWRAWVEHGNTFLLHDGDTAVGLVAMRTEPSSPGVAHLLAMWVDPVARGAGGADLLVQAVIDAATAADATTIELCVMDGNEPARRLYERHGFEPTGDTCARERDGGVEVTMQRRRPDGPD